MSGIEEVGAAAVLAAELVEETSPLDLLATLADVIRSMSPTEGLSVTPHVFQSTEIEGKWKEKARFGQGRELAPQSPGEHEETPKAPQSAATKQPVGTPAKSAASVTTKKKRLFDPATPDLHQAQLLTISITGGPVPDSLALFQALWYGDGLEIWAGLASHRNVRGFGSVYGHQAEVVLTGLPFGNYFPTRYFLAFTGVLNPVGPGFEEFRGAVALKADGTAEPLFCQRWDRDLNVSRADYTSVGGYHLNMPH